MKKVDFKLGGNFLLNDTLKFIQEGNSEDVKAITDALFRNKTGNTPFRLLDGWKIASLGNNNYTWTKGYAYVEGEVYEIPAQSSVINIDFSLYGVFAEKISDSSIDPIIYKNGTSQEIHFKNVILFKEISTNVGALGTMSQLYQFKALHVLWTNMLSEQYIVDVLLDTVYEYGWVNLTNLQNINTSQVASSFTPQVRKIGRKVEFRGRFYSRIPGWSMDFPIEYAPLPIGDGYGVTFVVGNGSNQIWRVDVVPFGGGRIEGSLISGGATGDGAYGFDISTISYYLPE